MFGLNLQPGPEALFLNSMAATKAAQKMAALATKKCYASTRTRLSRGQISGYVVVLHSESEGHYVLSDHDVERYEL